MNLNMKLGIYPILTISLKSDQSFSQLWITFVNSLGTFFFIPLDNTSYLTAAGVYQNKDFVLKLTHMNV